MALIRSRMNRHAVCAAIERQLRDCGLFDVRSRRFYPCLLPIIDLNLIGCLECVKLKR